MDYLLVQATNGLVIGIIYALVAVGVTLIFSILKIVNDAYPVDSTRPDG
jgi:branched-chain amino acid transport system permease protein